MNKPALFAPASEGARSIKKYDPSERFPDPSTIHYPLPKEPRVSAWTLLWVVALLSVVAFFLIKFVHS